MFEYPKRLWLLYLLSGIVLILLGILIVFLPGLTINLFLIFFGVIAIFLGLTALVRMLLSIKRHKKWWLYMVEAIIGIAIGILILLFPSDSTIAILYFIGGWAIIIGIWEILYGIEFRRTIKNESLLILSGIISLLVGILIFIKPGAGAFLLLAIAVFYVVVRGVISLMVAVRLKRFKDDEEVKNG